MIRVIGHRGAMGCRIENTIASFHEALRQGATGLEMDIRQARSGELVVFHDGDLRRLAGVEGRVEELDVEEIEKLRLRDPDLPNQEERIPLLEAVIKDPMIRDCLQEGPEYLVLCLEIKGKGIEKSMVEFIEARDLTDRVVVYSFHVDTLCTVRAWNPHLWTNLLFGEEREHHLRIATQHGITMVNPEPHDVDRAFIGAAHRADRLVNIGRTNDPQQIRRLLELDVWGIHSDWPERVVNGLQKREEGDG